MLQILYVATIAPTKRGLKVVLNYSYIIKDPRGSNHCPDEKGTESQPRFPYESGLF